MNWDVYLLSSQIHMIFNPFVTSGTYIYVPHTKSLFKSAGITVSHFFSMLPSTLKYLYSIEPVRMHFPTKQLCTTDTVCNAACSIAHSVICTRLFCGKMHSQTEIQVDVFLLNLEWHSVFFSPLQSLILKWEYYIMFR